MQGYDAKVTRGRIIAIVAVTTLWVIVVLLMVKASGEEYHSNPGLLKWIPATCCVTNDCCWEIDPQEVRSLPDDEWEIKATGQVRRRTAWSPDGRYYRCACDYDNVSKSWIKHQGANTRCLFVPRPSV